MPFDPNQPFEVVGEEPAKPGFDPSQPFEAVAETPTAPAAAQEKPAFDSTQPFEQVAEPALGVVNTFRLEFGKHVYDALSGLASSQAAKLQQPSWLGGVIQSGLDKLGITNPETRQENIDTLKLTAEEYKKQGENYAKDIGISSTAQPSKLGQTIEGVAEPLLWGSLGLPAFVAQHRLQTYGHTYNETGDNQKAQQAADRATAADALFIGGTSAIAEGLGAALKRTGTEGLKAWAVKASGATAGNVTVGQFTKAAEAAIAAPPDKKREAFTTAFNDLAGADAGAYTLFGIMAASHGVPHPRAPVEVQQAQEVVSRARTVAPRTAEALQTQLDSSLPTPAVTARAEALRAAMNPELRAQNVAAGAQENFIEGTFAPEVAPEVAPFVKLSDAQLDDRITAAEAVTAKQNLEANQPDPVYQKMVDSLKAEKARRIAEAPPEPAKLTEEQATKVRDVIDKLEVGPNEKAQLLEVLRQRSAAPPKITGPVLTAPDNAVLAEGQVGATHASLTSEALPKYLEANPDADPNSMVHQFRASDGSVLPRPEAWKIAKAAGQIKPEKLALKEADAAKTGKEPELESQDLIGAPLGASPPEPRVVPPVIPQRPLPEPAPPPSRTQVAVAAKLTPEERTAKIEQATTEVRGEVEKSGLLPSVAELRSRLHNDAGAARALHDELAAGIAAKYPSEPLPTGATEESAKNTLTGDKLPSINENGKLRPRFTNDPNITAQQIDNGSVGTDTANRLYVPDEIMDNDQLNPAIDTAYDKEAGKFYVTKVTSKFGEIAKPGDFEAPYRADKAFQKAHQLVLGGTAAETELIGAGARPAEENSVGQALVENGFAEDAIPLDLETAEPPEGAIATRGPLRPADKTDALARRNIAAIKQFDFLTMPADPMRYFLTKILRSIQPSFEPGKPTDPRAPVVQPWMRVLARTILDSGIDLSKIEFEWTNQPKADYSGIYLPDPVDATKGRIEVNTAADHESGLFGTVMHELFHHITLAKIDPNYKRNPVEQKAYEDLQKLFEHVTKEIYKLNFGREGTPEEIRAWRELQTGPEGQRLYYGVTHLREFITESLTSPRFMKILDQLPELAEVKSSGRFKNLLATIRYTLKRLFTGVSQPNSTLDQAVDRALTLAETPIDRSRTQAAAQTLGDAVRAGLTEAEAQHLEGARFYIDTPQGKKYGQIHTIGSMGEPEKIPGTENQYTIPIGKAVQLEDVTGQGDYFASVLFDGSDTVDTIPADDINLVKPEVTSPAPLSRSELEAQVLDKGIDQDTINTSTTAELQKMVSNEAAPETVQPTKTIEQDGWLGPDGNFHPAPMTEGGHESIASMLIQGDPKLQQEFTAAHEEAGVKADDVYKFMEDRGFIRVVHGGEGGTTYVMGKPTRQQLQLLKDNAIEQHATLVQDFGNRSRILYSPNEALSRQPGDTAPKITQTPAGHTLDIPDGSTRAELRDSLDSLEGRTDLSEADRTRITDELTNALGPTITLTKGKAKDRILYGYDAVQNIANNYGKQQANRVALDFGSAAKPTPEQLQDRAAAPFVIEAGGNKEELVRDLMQVLHSKDPNLAEQYAPIIQHAIDNFDRLNEVTQNYRVVSKEQLQRERDAGIDTKEVDNYVGRLLDMPGSKETVLPSSGGQGSPRYFMKGRRFEKLADAIKEGYAPKTTDIVDLLQRRVESGERLVQQKLLESELRDLNAPDGRPIIGDTSEYQALSGKMETTVPRGYTLVQTGGRPLVVNSEMAPLFKALYGDSTINQALKTVAGKLKKTTLAIDTFHVGRIMFKELAYSKGAQRFGYNKGLSLLEYTPEDLGRAVKAGDITQEMADYAQEILPSGLTRRGAAEELIKRGLNVGKVSDNLLAEHNSTIPFLDNFNGWVFNKLSRGAMIQTALENFERNMKRFPERGVEGNARQTAKESNEVFGNMQNQGLFTNKNYQDLARALVLAPNWAESQLRAELRGYGQIARGAGELLTGKARLGAVAQGQLTVILGMLAANQIVNFLSTGHSTFQNKEGHKLDVFIPGGAHGFWFSPLEIGAEYAHMAMRYYSQHQTIMDSLTQIAKNKLGPVARASTTLISGRDYAGRSFATQGDRIRGAIADLIPIPIGLSGVIERDPRQLFGLRRNRQVGSAERQGLQSLGLKVTPAQSPTAEVFALAYPFRSDRSYQGPVEYRDLRSALDNNDEESVQKELAMLASRGKNTRQIESAIGVGAKQKFTDSTVREVAFVRALTPDQKKLYDQAQQDHLVHAKLLMKNLRAAPPELRAKLRENLKPELPSQ